MNQVILVNGKEIIIETVGTEEFVAVKPICKAIGVNYDKQYEKLKRNEILSNVLTIEKTVANDGKRYKMLVLPLKYALGWVFGINENRP